MDAAEVIALWSRCSELILVPGHAIYQGCSHGDPAADENWVLRPFQKGEGRLLIEHVRYGVELAAGRSDSLLIFSGGQTRLEAGPYSEATGYWRLASGHDWWGHSGTRWRAVTEEFARDSLENVVYGLCRFRECTGHYPARLVVIGWKFKQRRFEQYFQALRWPVGALEYHGPNDPPVAQLALEQERQAIQRFEQFLAGNAASFLAQREQRNPFRRTPPYALTCPELRSFLLALEQGRWEPPPKFPWECF